MDALASDGRLPAREPAPADGGKDSGRGRLQPGAARVLGALITTTLIGSVMVAGFIAYGLLGNRWYHVVAVTGGSMAPTIESGDLIVITRPPANVEPGMVLTMEVDGAVVTHRVVAVRSDGSFVTQGDANDVRDDFSANRVRIVGEYRFRIPWLGDILEAARRTTSGAFFADRATVDVTGQVGGALAPDSLLPAAEPAPEAPPPDVGGDSDRAPSPEPMPTPEPSPAGEPAASPEPSPAGEPAASLDSGADVDSAASPPAEPSPASEPLP